MEYFTDMNATRQPIERTSTITVEIYILLFNCCERYYDHIAWKFPHLHSNQYSGARICKGIALTKLYDFLEFEIPTLYGYMSGGRKNISKPSKLSRKAKFDQYALIDFIEFIANNLKDISCQGYNSIENTDELVFSDTCEVFDEFRDEINNIFNRTGLLFTLTDKKRIERVIEHGVLSKEVENIVTSVAELGLKALLEEAIALFKQPNPTTRKTAVEKIWDALERLKTYYSTLDKRGSSEKIVNEMGNGQTEFTTLFNDEFKTLTIIGNNFRIRHHETNKIDILDYRHYDYLFNRCLSLIALAIQYLQ